jgi:hypothetical protein
MPKATQPITTPYALDAQFIRARCAVPVLVNGPGDAEHPPLRFRGRLLGAMYAREQVHHYRVEDGNGTLFLTPPSWIVGNAPVLEPAAALETVA